MQRQAAGGANPAIHVATVVLPAGDVLLPPQQWCKAGAAMLLPLPLACLHVNGRVLLFLQQRRHALLLDALLQLLQDALHGAGTCGDAPRPMLQACRGTRKTQGAVPVG